MIEKELMTLQQRVKVQEACLWGEFNTKQTWLQIRSQGLRLDWTRCIWFSHATPKYSVINGWMGNWSTHHTSQHFMHSLQCSNRNHIFFECGD